MAMRAKVYSTTLLCLLMVSAGPLSAQPKKARFSVSSVSIAQVPFRIAQVKSFYRDEGLDVEFIFIRGAP